MDVQAIKQQQRDDWNRAASSWRAHDEDLRRAGASVTRRLLEMAAIEPGQRVLDLASGTGEPGLPAAEVVGPSGFVLLTDQSAAMLAVGRDKARVQGLTNVGFLVADSERLQLEPASFDAALCRGALPLMPEPIACLRIAYESLRPGGRLALSVIGHPRANPHFTIPFRVMRKYVSLPRHDPDAAGPFYFAEPERLRSILAEAGFRELHIEAFEHPSQEFESGYEYWQYTRQFSMHASVLAQIPADQHDSVAAEVAAAAAGGDPHAESGSRASRYSRPV